MMVDLSRKEMAGISRAIEVLENFHEGITEVYGAKFDGIEVTGPECTTLKITNSEGNVIGYVDWTESGDIEFIVNDE
jgi:hypothetical protein